MGRFSSRTANSYTTTFGYVAGGHGTKSTTPLIASITQPNMNFSYTYDNRGNITSETRNGSTTTYVYDGLGQLTRVNDPHENATWVYNYDRGGNITSKVKYAYTTGTLGTAQQTIGYTYDSVWKDKMIAFSDRTMTYDAIGNLTNYAGWVYEWQNGRQLKKQTQNETVVTYDYDHNGMRTRKTVGNTSGSVSEVYNYTYSGTKLVHLTRNSDALHFFYDANGKPAFVKFNGTMYRYVHNLQGDIVGIVDSNNAIVVEYKYTTWGMILSRSGSMSATLGYLNPFRYRSYIYDEETWMYWLRSRYYYPELHRFINADKRVNANLFCYCENTPIYRVDSSGLSSICAETVNSTDVTLYIFTGKNYGHYTVGAMGMVFSWESANNGCLVIYSEDVLEAEMVKAGFDSIYYTITVSLPTDAVSKAIKNIYEHCSIDYLESEFPFALKNHLNIKYEFHVDGKKKEYNPFENSCFAFVDWFFDKAGVNLEELIGGSITKEVTHEKKKKKQYLFAQEFLEIYPQYRKTNSRIGY